MVYMIVPYLFYRGPDNPHMRTLRDILVTFSAFHTKVSYAQGMNDILSRFLVVLDNEVGNFLACSLYLIPYQYQYLSS